MKQWDGDFAFELGFSDRVLIQIGAAEDRMVDVNILPLYQQSYERTAQGTAIGSTDAVSAVYPPFGFLLLSSLQPFETQNH